MVNGKAAIRAGWAKLIGSPGFNIDWQINKLEIGRAGDLAYTIYTYQLALEANGKPITDHGKDMAVWKKQSDGTWKMVADTFNSDLPVIVPAKNPDDQASHGQTPSEQETQFEITGSWRPSENLFSVVRCKPRRFVP